MIRIIYLKMVASLVMIFSCWGCSNYDKYSITEVDLLRIQTDSLPDISKISEMRLHDEELYLTYETQGSWGQQFVSRYSMDFNEGMMHFEKDYFKKENGYYQFFAPLLFTDTESSLYVSGRDELSVYLVSSEGIAYNNGDYIMTNDSNVPYEMVMEARQIFHYAPHEYIFIGRKPKDGMQGIYHSDNTTGGIEITEVSRIVYDDTNISWTANFGRMTYNSEKGVAAFAFQMFPAVQFIDVRNGKAFNVVLPNTESVQLITDRADIWEQNDVQFKDITSNSNHIYALYWGMGFDEAENKKISGNGESKVIRFDWKGNITDVYVFDICISSIAVSEDDSLILGHDGEYFYYVRVD